jgi:hypothetical protein
MRSLIAGALVLALGLAFTGPAWAGKGGKLKACNDSSGRVYYVPKAGSGKGLYWGSSPKTAQPLKDGQRVYIIPKRGKR